MNPALIILFFIAVFIIWFCGSWMYPIVGARVSLLIKNFSKNLNKNDENEGENE